MKKLKEIYKRKGSDIAVFLGSGPSINNITDEQWKAISGLDTWTVNNWVYHPFVPRFYHVEAKKLNMELLKKRMGMRDDYEDVNFIVNRKRLYLLDIIGPRKYVYGYKMDKINIVNEPIVPKYKPNHKPGMLVCNLNSSITLLLELLWRFRYKKVVFFGMDLVNSLYFWTGRSEYGEVHCQWNKDHEGRRPEQQHNTAHIKDFVVWFSKKRMGEIGGEFFVGHKDTLLYPGLRHFKL